MTARGAGSNHSGLHKEKEDTDMKTAIATKNASRRAQRAAIHAARQEVRDITFELNEAIETDGALRERPRRT